MFVEGSVALFLGRFRDNSRYRFAQMWQAGGLRFWMIGSVEALVLTVTVAVKWVLFLRLACLELSLTAHGYNLPSFLQ